MGSVYRIGKDYIRRQSEAAITISNFAIGWNLYRGYWSKMADGGSTAKIQYKALEIFYE